MMADPSRIWVVGDSPSPTGIRLARKPLAAKVFGLVAWVVLNSVSTHSRLSLTNKHNLVLKKLTLRMCTFLEGSSGESGPSPSLVQPWVGPTALGSEDLGDTAAC